ncbi:MAG: hypothetical protein KDB01_17735, partial [Planctomycetaceae bacterium]|nr:hypothetical protein [Planctomycetaceae bacterium]
SDAQVFVNMDQRVNRIRGPVFIEGGNRIGAEQFLNDPVMMPGETNYPREDGSVTGFNGSGPIATMTDSKIQYFDPDTKQLKDGFDPRMNNYPYSITFLNGVLKGYTFDVASVSGNTVTFKTPWPVDADGNAIHPETSNAVPDDPATTDVDESLLGAKYFITAVNLNLHVNEEEQVDTLNLYNSLSPNDESVTLTNDHISGLGMGPATVVGGEAFAGGISFSGIDSLNVHLGTGDNTVTVESTITGDTSISSSSGNDTFRIKTVSGPTTIRTGTGTDVVNITSDDTTIDQITALLTVAGDGINDTLNIDDSADVNDNVGTLTERTLTGLDMPSVAEVQVMRVQATGGTFGLTIAGATAPETLNYGATAAQVQTALTTLFGAAAGDIRVTSVVDGPAYYYTITFAGQMGGVNVAEIQWAESPEINNLTGTAEISRDVRVDTSIQGTTVPLRSNIQTLTVSATAGTFGFSLLGTAITIDTEHATKSILTQLQEALDSILNPNNSEGFLPHTKNFVLRQFGNTYEILFRGARADAAISALNTTLLTGSAVLQTRTSGINYYGFSTLNLGLGSGNDALNIQGTAAGSTNNINTAAGDDRIDMSSDADITSGAGLTGTTDLIAGDVNLDAGSGTNRLRISDAADITGDNISLTRNTGTTTETLTLAGIAGGNIVFRALTGNFDQGVTIFGGSGGNTFTVDGVFAGAPNL